MNDYSGGVSKKEQWTFGIRPLWIQMFFVGVFLMAVSHSAAPIPALGGFLVGIAVALWK